MKVISASQPRQTSFVTILLLASTLSAGSGWAQDGAAIQVGETSLIPSVELQYFTDSNAFSESVDEQEGAGFRVKPELRWTADYRTTKLEARYNGEYSQGDLDTLDYDDHRLTLSGNAGLSKRSRLNGLFIIENRNLSGSDTLRLGPDQDSLLTTDTISFTLRHRYGADRARGNLRTSIYVRDRSFSDDDSGLVRSDFTEVRPSVAFSLRVGSATRAFAELELRFLDYDTSNQDRNQTNLFFGLEWVESEVFGASAKLGILDYRFPDQTERDGTDFGLEVGGYYSPAPHSRFDFLLGRSLYDDNDGIDLDAAEATLLDEFSLEWSYDWSSRVSHQARLEIDLLERSCSSQNQSDTRGSFNMQLAVRRWIAVGAGVSISTRDFDGCEPVTASADTFDYSREQFSIFAKFTL